MKELTLPSYSFKIAGEPGSEKIFDPIRKKYVRLTPEEWVRQHFAMYLVNEGNYPPGLIIIEASFGLYRTKKRIDILVHDRAGKPVMIVECKEPDTPLDEKVFEQIATYNMEFRVPYLVVTNGIRNLACRMDFGNMKFEFLEVIPQYGELIK